MLLKVPPFRSLIGTFMSLIRLIYQKIGLSLDPVTTDMVVFLLSYGLLLVLMNN